MFDVAIALGSNDGMSTARKSKRSGSTVRFAADVIGAALALSFAVMAPARAQDFKTFSTQGLPRSEGMTVRVNRPSHWKMVVPDDPLVLAELRGPQGSLTGILQIGRGGTRKDIESLCKPERARTMLQGLVAQEPDVRVTDVFARSHEGRAAYEIRYERNNAPTFMLVRSVIVCLKDSRVLVSCAGAGPVKSALAGIEPVCRQVLESLSISEE